MTDSGMQAGDRISRGGLWRQLMLPIGDRAKESRNKIAYKFPSFQPQLCGILRHAEKWKKGGLYNERDCRTVRRWHHATGVK